MSPPETILSSDAVSLHDTLARWVERGWLRALDRAFAAFLAREAPDANPLLILAAALASHQLGRGHVCLDLTQTLADPGMALSLPPEGDEDPDPPALPGDLLAGVGLANWVAALSHPDLVADGAGNTPLVRAGARLYLRRYWQYEQDVRHAIGQRLAATPRVQAGPAPGVLRSSLDALFPRDEADAGATDWQKIACAIAARSAFAVVTGGPGTGKTTTVVRLLALLQGLALDDGRALRIRLAAPTGKAAARLNESIAGAVASLSLDALPHGEAVRAAIPVEVTTLHRLLGSRPETRRLRHDASNPLALDVLVIDEASMVDLEMMAATMAALPPDARLVLLGDKDQLASVEAGGVLGALCSRAEAGSYTPQTRDWITDVVGETIAPDFVDAAGTPLDQVVTMLRVSHRFSAESGIGTLAEAVNAGDVERVRAVFAHGHRDAVLLEPEGIEQNEFARLVLDGRDGGPVGFRHYLKVLAENRPSEGADQAVVDAWANQVLLAHREFQVLCAVRRGPCGVDALNRHVANLLRARGLILSAEGWYAGRPVLVTRNDYGLGLMNGDIGIALPVPGAPSDDRPTQPALRVAFPVGDGGGIKWVLPSRLSAVETVFAMTVHKAQGSEFAHVALVLPERINPGLTRELIYTGITRAREWLTVVSVGRNGVLEEAISRRCVTSGGLMT